MAKAAKPQPDNELRLAWAAGLFEGEGSIGIRQDRPHANKKLYPFLGKRRNARLHEVKEELCLQ